MQVITDLTQLDIGAFLAGKDSTGTALAIGKFDGVHKGHKKILERLLYMQQTENLVPTILTFDPSPESFFGHGPEFELSTREEKHRLFERLGIELLIEFPFNKETAATPPEAFIRDTLVHDLQVRFVAAGPDLSFGDRGSGNYELLQFLSARYGYEAEMVQKEQYKGQVISSTLVRSLVAEGRMEEVTACLGEPYSIIGKVRHGNRIGRTIDIPTVNQIPEPEKLLPPHGVYYSDVLVDGRMYHGMTNIGVKPSVTDGSRLTVETYLYGFEGDIYGEEIVTLLHTFRRPEMHFDGLEALRQKMSEDVAAGRAYFQI